jgi:hypothetical protein
MEKIKELHTVALLKDIPSKNLRRGDVGTVVIDLTDSMVEVEFIDEKGRTASIVALAKSDLIRLRMDVIPA